MIEQLMEQIPENVVKDYLASAALLGFDYEHRSPDDRIIKQ